MAGCFFFFYEHAQVLAAFRSPSYTIVVYAQRRRHTVGRSAQHTHAASLSTEDGHHISGCELTQRVCRDTPWHTLEIQGAPMSVRREPFVAAISLDSLDGAFDGIRVTGGRV